MRLLAPWVAFALLSLLFELSMAVRPDGLDPSVLRPTVELPLLLGLYGASRSLRRGGRAVRWVLGVTVTLLVLVRLDHAVFFTLMRTPPLLYDQLFMVRHLFVLFGDLWSPLTAAVLLGSLVGLALLVTLARVLLGVWWRAFDAPVRRRTGMILGGYVAALCLASGISTGGERPLVQWMTPALADNLARSVDAYRSIQRGIRDSPYREYADLALSRRPDIQLFMVESYGRVLGDDPALYTGWYVRLLRMQKHLAQRGWHMASAFSRAPVSGARSWLSEASILLGAPVIYEAVFQHLMGQLDRTPNLPRILGRLGYTTVLLAPADRRRPGVEDVNRYGYDHYVRFDDLGYRGPSVGWGLVPDQYSLHHTERHVLSHATGPVFFNFHMVSSHAPWRQVPAYVARWQELALPGAGALEDRRRGELEKRMKRYERKAPRAPYMGRFSWRKRADYAHAIDYDLQVIEGYLKTQQGDRLVILVGDHQPPVISHETESFDVPVHVLARDPELLAGFLDQGFTPGLVLDPRLPAALRHEGMLSLLMRALARCCAEAAAPPEYRPEGFDLTGLGTVGGEDAGHSLVGP